MERTERQDEIEYCERCGISFLWSAEEQKRRADMPRLCSGCRRLLPQADRAQAGEVVQPEQALRLHHPPGRR
ncbi:MAG: hypothetical protein R2838_05615 [Caldilineaceae bacterium]